MAVTLWIYIHVLVKNAQLDLLELWSLIVIPKVFKSSRTVSHALRRFCLAGFSFTDKAVCRTWFRKLIVLSNICSSRLSLLLAVCNYK